MYTDSDSPHECSRLSRADSPHKCSSLSRTATQARATAATLARECAHKWRIHTPVNSAGKTSNDGISSGRKEPDLVGLGSRENTPLDGNDGTDGKRFCESTISSLDEVDKSCGHLTLLWPTKPSRHQWGSSRTRSARKGRRRHICTALSPGAWSHLRRGHMRDWDQSPTAPRSLMQ